MQSNSAVYKVLSPEKIPPLDMGAVLSIFNNSHHPELTMRGVNHFQEAEVLLSDCVHKLKHLSDLLGEHPISTKEFNLAVSFLHSYIYIIQVTLDLPKNARFVNYTNSARGGV